MKRVAALVVCAMVLSSGVTRGADVRWIGGTGSWNTATNWQSGLIPTADDTLVGVNGGTIIVDAPGAELGAGENASIDGGGLMVVSTGTLAVVSNFEVGRHNTAVLTVDGGAMTVGGVAFNGHYSDSTSMIDVKNGGSLTVSYFRNDGADSPIRLSGA